MEKTSFENLKIYQLSERLADLVWEETSRWQPLARDTIGKQFIRAADSVGANIAEGDGKGSFTDNRRYLRNTRGSLYECKHWIRRSVSRNLLSTLQAQPIIDSIEELLPRLNAYLRWVETKIAKSPKT